MRVAGELVAFGCLFADRQQADARTVEAERHARVDVAHHRELQQVLRPALDARADVEQDRRARGRRHRRRERRSIDSRQHAERRVRRHHGRARVTGAEEGGRVAARHHLGGHADRGVRLAAQRGRRCLVHRDDVGRVDDANTVGMTIGMALQLGVDRVAAAHEHDAEVEVARRGERAVDEHARREVAAHGVDGYPQHRVQGSGFRVQGSRSRFKVRVLVRFGSVRVRF